MNTENRPRRFTAALEAARAAGRIPLISEIKVKSPKEGDLLAGRDPVALDKIALLGVAYKRDVDDSARKPVVCAIGTIARRGAVVTYNDPHVSRLPRLRAHDLPPLASQELTAEYLSAQDCILIATDHSAYDYEFIVEHARLVIDTRNAAARVTSGREKIVKA